ncbi:hypothetical protein [Pontibacter sp. HSC-36F09]|uniref:hypothetical protein n=1 Tax=Pontibacter sp. HSC-36F09 TaxID=2910966 RepID=UPI00209E2CAB|nr:hypothetical protein [Pontibacter sp. HSC-36F09]MCP2044714.1 hypothetical protein [Pontibacter sp. HSC-36F09]
MKDYYIEENAHAVTINFEWQGSYRPYPIPKKELGMAQGQESMWMMQVLDKPWASKKMLHDLAGYIKRYKPDNKIDWDSTFSIVNSCYN